MAQEREKGGGKKYGVSGKSCTCEDIEVRRMGTKRRGGKGEGLGESLREVMGRVGKLNDKGIRGIGRRRKRKGRMIERRRWSEIKGSQSITSPNLQRHLYGCVRASLHPKNLMAGSSDFV